MNLFNSNYRSEIKVKWYTPPCAVVCNSISGVWVYELKKIPSRWPLIPYSEVIQLQQEKTRSIPQYQHMLKQHRNVMCNLLMIQTIKTVKMQIWWTESVNQARSGAAYSCRCSSYGGAVIPASATTTDARCTHYIVTTFTED